MMTRRGGKGLIGAALLCVLLLGPVPASADLTTFGYGNSRLGTSSAGAGIAPKRVPSLQTAWRAKIGGAINSEALVVNGLRIKGHRHNVAFVASEHGNVVAIDTSRGAILCASTSERDPSNPTAVRHRTVGSA